MTSLDREKQPSVNFRGSQVLGQHERAGAQNHDIADSADEAVPPTTHQLLKRRTRLAFILEDVFSVFRTGNISEKLKLGCLLTGADP